VLSLVVSDDTALKVADVRGCKLEDIAASNPCVNLDVLFPGGVFILPETCTCEGTSPNIPQTGNFACLIWFRDDPSLLTVGTTVARSATCLGETQNCETCMIVYTWFVINSNCAWIQTDQCRLSCCGVELKHATLAVLESLQQSLFEVSGAASKHSQSGGHMWT
jgi:hypothetical protein